MAIVVVRRVYIYICFGDIGGTVLEVVVVVVVVEMLVCN